MEKEQAQRYEMIAILTMGMDETLTVKSKQTMADMEETL